MITAFDPHDWRGHKLQEWLLLLLRYAITRDLSHRSAVFAVADELDSLGGQWRPAAPRFFLRTSNEVCDAILSFENQPSKLVLRSHIARIPDLRIRRAFEAAINPHWAKEPQQTSGGNRTRRSDDLFRGLSAK